MSIPTDTDGRVDGRVPGTIPGTAVTSTAVTVAEGDVPVGDRNIPDREFKAAWTDWHAAHERLRADPHGFLAVTHLHWLDTSPARLDGARIAFWSLYRSTAFYFPY